MAISGTMPEPPAIEQQRIGGRGVPHEIATDRAAHLEPVAQHQLVDQERRDLAVRDALDGQVELRLVGRRRGDRVAALGLVAVLRGQPNVDVLARRGALTSPGR